MTQSRLARLFSPRSIAVVGGRVADSVVEEMLKLGFTGEIWPVNPKRSDMHGITCFKSIDDLPSPPDAVYLGIHRDAAIESIAILSAMGVGGVICHASGFAELGDAGHLKNRELLDAAGDMPVVGPNCWGILNLMDRAAMWPDFHGAVAVEKGVAIVNQSGNIALNYTMQKRGLDIALIVTLGNQLMIDANDCIEVFLDDDRISAIGLHVEGLNDVQRFSELAIRAQQLGKPIVALKTGVSDKGAHATVSHTATLAGADTLYDALFERFGIARIHSIPEFLETLKLLSILGRPVGNRLATLSCSGGEASLMADRAEAHGLELPDLSSAHSEKVRKTVNDFVDVTNPLDYHTFIWAQHDAMVATFGSVMSDVFDITALVLDYPRQDRSRYAEYDIAVDAWIEATKSTGATTAVIATLPECMPEPIALKLAVNGIVPFLGVEEALATLSAVSKTLHASGIALSPNLQWPQSPQTLDESASKKLLGAFGLPVPESRLIDAANTANAAAEIGFPVALKISGVAHKTESGGVRLGLTDPVSVTRATTELSTLSNQFLVETMVENSICELIVGINRDSQFGLALVIGAGGILTELIQDNTSLLFPVSREDIDRALGKLKINKLLTGYRGKTVDRESVVKVIEQVARFAESNEDTLLELDINPLIVCSDSVTIADALIRKSFLPGDNHD